MLLPAVPSAIYPHVQMVPLPSERRENGFKELAVVEQPLMSFWNWAVGFFQNKHSGQLQRTKTTQNECLMANQTLSTPFKVIPHPPDPFLFNRESKLVYFAAGIQQC